MKMKRKIGSSSGQITTSLKAKGTLWPTANSPRMSLRDMKKCSRDASSARPWSSSENKTFKVSLRRMPRRRRRRESVKKRTVRLRRKNARLRKKRREESKQSSKNGRLLCRLRRLGRKQGRLQRTLRRRIGDSSNLSNGAKLSC